MQEDHVHSSGCGGGLQSLIYRSMGRTCAAAAGSKVLGQRHRRARQPVPHCGRAQRTETSLLNDSLDLAEMAIEIDRWPPTRLQTPYVVGLIDFSNHAWLAWLARLAACAWIGSEA